MLDNPASARVRAVAALSRRATRAETGNFLLEGPQTLREVLRFRPELVREVFVTAEMEKRHSDVFSLVVSANIPTTLISDRVAKRLADTVTPQGFFAVCRQFFFPLAQLLTDDVQLVAIAHQVRDPGNAGTVIRVADAAGADAIIFTGNSVDIFHPKVVRATTGSLFHLPTAQNISLTEVLSLAREVGLEILAADISGQDMFGIRERLRKKTAWIFGNEAHGLTDSDLAYADATVRIPIYGSAESLNLAMAATVCLYQSAFAQHEARPK